MDSTGQSSVGYLYDRNSNLRLSLNGLSYLSYLWDTAGNMVKVYDPLGTDKGAYAYDGLGRRVESVEGSSVAFYAYLGTETLFEKKDSVNTDYVYAAGLRIAKIAATTVNYYHTDHLGSTRLVTSTTKAVVFSDNYQPFGTDNGTPTCSGTCETYKFTGKPVSQTTGLYYNYQRWYDPSIGRFVSEDPLPGQLASPQTLNRYVYVSNRPTTLTDPAGLSGQLMTLLPHRTCPDVFKDFVGWLGCGFGIGQVGSTIGGTGGPELGISSDVSAAGEGAGPMAGAVVIAGLALWGLKMLADYIRTPHDIPDVIPPGSDGPALPRVPVPPIPTPKFLVGPTAVAGLGPSGADVTATLSNFRWTPRPLTDVQMKGIKGSICAGVGFLFLSLYLFGEEPQAAQGKNFAYQRTPPNPFLAFGAFGGPAFACAYFLNR